MEAKALKPGLQIGAQLAPRGFAKALVLALSDKGNLHSRDPHEIVAAGIVASLREVDITMDDYYLVGRAAQDIVDLG